MIVELLETVYVVDGRFFNHLVVLLKREILSTSINRYVECANELYKENAINVFQWISRKPGRKKNTKSTECARRSICFTRHILFDVTMQTTRSPCKFLSNERNKSKLITMLITKLVKADLTVKQAAEDADTLIVTTVI